jgi:hypothetical protein
VTGSSTLANAAGHRLHVRSQRPAQQPGNTVLIVLHRALMRSERPASL